MERPGTFEPPPPTRWVGVAVGAKRPKRGTSIIRFISISINLVCDHLQSAREGGSNVLEHLMFAVMNGAGIKHQWTQLAIDSQ